MKLPYYNAWSPTTHSKIEPCYDSNHNLIGFTGSYFSYGVEWKIKLNTQKANKAYSLRGTISPISPLDGYIMQKEDVVDQNNRIKHPHSNAIVGEIYINSQDMAVVKEKIASRVDEIYLAHQSIICGQLQLNYRRDHITPTIAALLYAEKYVDDTYKGASEKTRSDRITLLSRLLFLLPNTYMQDISTANVCDIIKEHNLTYSPVNLLYNFWEWLLNHAICLGENPVFKPNRRNISPEILQERSEIPEELSILQQDSLYYMCQANPSEVSCGIAVLMGTGISISRALSLNWSDITINAKNIVLMQKLHEKAASPTQNYTAPVIPHWSKIIIAQREKVFQIYGDKLANKLPIVGKPANPTEPMSLNSFCTSLKKYLIDSGIDPALTVFLHQCNSSALSRLLENTFRKNIDCRCGFGTDNPGIAKFLKGQSLRGSVTCDNYTSFTCQEAVDRMLVALSRCAPLQKISDKPYELEENDQCQVYTMSPRTTKDIVVCNANILLMSHDIIDIICSHGVDGLYEVIDDDNNFSGNETIADTI